MDSKDLSHCDESKSTLLPKNFLLLPKTRTVWFSMHHVYYYYSYISKNGCLHTHTLINKIIWPRFDIFHDNALVYIVLKYFYCRVIKSHNASLSMYGNTEHVKITWLALLHFGIFFCTSLYLSPKCARLTSPTNTFNDAIIKLQFLAVI